MSVSPSIELRDSNSPAKGVARDFKDKLYDYFTQQAVLLRAKDPKMLAEQLVLLFDGSVAWIVMRRKLPTSTRHTLSLLLKG